MPLLSTRIPRRYSDAPPSHSDLPMYLILKTLHVGSAICSAGGFVLRGYWMLAASPLLERRMVRILPHVIDTVLLLSGVGLIVLLRLQIMQSDWLLAKFAALTVYIVLGATALRRGRTRRARGVAFVLALLTFLYIVGIAVAKSPRGWFAGL